MRRCCDVLLTVAGPLNQPPADQFRNFDEEANSLMNSLTNLDPDDEPRSRGLGAASRANSVRFDETANQNHFTHSLRPSVDFLSRSSSGGLGGLQMNERSSSHKSEGRASSAHSMRSAASGRANSLNLDTNYGMSDSRASPLDPPVIAPGMLLLGSVPSIIRCWMNENFKHDSLLYAAVCTGSHRSYLDMQLVLKLGYEICVTPPNEDGLRTARLPVYFPEAVPTVPLRSLSIHPAPQLPKVDVDFVIVENSGGDDQAIQIFLGSDMLNAHSADVLLSSNNLTLYDDDSQKLSIPLVRPENEAAFRNLYVTSGRPSLKPSNMPKESAQLNGLGQGSSAASVSSGTTSPRPTTKYRPPGLLTADLSSSDSVKAGAGPDSESDFRPASRQSTASRPSLNVSIARSEAQDSVTQTSDAASSTTTARSGTSPAIWGNWRSSSTSTPTASASTPANAASGSSSGNMDWATSTRTRDGTYQRRDTGIKVLKPTKPASSRTFSTSTTASSTTPTAAASASPAPESTAGVGLGMGSIKGSRFFDEGKRRGSELGSVGDKKEGERAPQQQAKKANPIGGAFSWMK